MCQWFAILEIGIKIFIDYSMAFVDEITKNIPKIYKNWMRLPIFRWMCKIIGWNFVHSSICGFITVIVVANALLLKTWKFTGGVRWREVGGKKEVFI